MKKYGVNEVEGLKDKRGKTKAEPELSLEEKMKWEMKKLERENEHLKAELAFLKSWKKSKRGDFKPSPFRSEVLDYSRAS